MLAVIRSSDVIGICVNLYLQPMIELDSTSNRFFLLIPKSSKQELQRDGIAKKGQETTLPNRLSIMKDPEHISFRCTTVVGHRFSIYGTQARIQRFPEKPQRSDCSSNQMFWIDPNSSSLRQCCLLSPLGSHEHSVVCLDRPILYSAVHLSSDQISCNNSKVVC